MDTILVAIDEHEHNKKVVDFSIDLAKSSGAKITLVYSVTSKSIPKGLTDEYRDESGQVQEDLYQRDVFERVVGDARRKVAKAGVECEEVYGKGNPAKFILATAKSKKAGAIVVGIHGFHNVGRIRALGEVARNVIEGSEIPVVAVP